MTAIERPSHGPTAHGEGCQCVRCSGFQPGNTAGLRHGVYGGPVLVARAAEHMATLRELVPGAAEGDDYAMGGLAMCSARLEALSVAFADLDGDDPSRQYRDDRGERLHKDARAWLRLALDYCQALGLTPSARLRLGIEAAEAQRLQREALDFSRLDDGELRDLRQLVAKAEGHS